MLNPYEILDMKPITVFILYGLYNMHTVFFFNVLVMFTYRQISYISRTWVGKKIVDHSDVVGASPVGAAPTTSPLST